MANLNANPMCFAKYIYYKITNIIKNNCIQYLMRYHNLFHFWNNVNNKCCQTEVFILNNTDVKYIECQYE